MRYKEAGVDVEKAERLVERIKKLAERTLTKSVEFGIGGFSGAFTVKGYKEPVFSVTTDGVGTKLKIAFLTGVHNTVGIDLVAMCVNDLITGGADPQVFLDYYACGKLDENIYVSVIEGIVKGCEEAECALVGGETAEMPDFYSPGEYDIAGFCVGVCEKTELIIPSLEEGDLVIGVSSSGLHSNGFSLVRRVVFDKMKFDVDTYIPELSKTLGEELLTPTKIYVKLAKVLKREVKLKGVAHITGGAFFEKPKRLLNPNVSLCIYKDSWDPPVIFKLIQKWGEIPEDEMYKTFNMGVGMLFVVSKDEADRALEVISSCGEKAFPIGEVVEGKGEVLLWEGKF